MPPGHSRERNLHDAGQLAARHGLTGLTVEEVAHDAGVSRLTVYHHFDSPGRLLEALGWSVLERADIGRVRQARMHPDPSKALREFVAPPRRSARAAPGSARTWLWHGAADEEVPIAAARRMAQLLPSYRASFTDEGHLMGLRHAGEAVEAIRGATAA
jgi:AcrR family transcriptional regulator